MAKIPDDAVRSCPEAIPAYAVPWLAAQMRVDPVILYTPGRVTGRCCTCGRHFRGDQTPERGKFIFLGKATCPFCGTRALTVVETSVRPETEYQADAAFFQAGADGTVWLRQFHVRRDERIFEHDPDRPPYECPADWLVEFGRIAVRDGAAALWLHEWKGGYMQAGGGRIWLDDWERKPRVYVGGFYDYRIMAESWTRAVADTPDAGRLRFLDLEDYTRAGGRSKILYMARWATYPVIEMLWKCGYRTLVEEKLRGSTADADRLVNIRARSARNVFRLPKAAMRLLPPGEWTYSKLGRTQVMLDAGTPLPRIKDWFIMGDHRILRTVAPHMAFREAKRYMEAQNEPEIKGGRPPVTWHEIADYLDDAAALGMDLTNRTVLFPRDLRERHAATSAERRLRADEAARKRMQARADKLVPFAWERDGLLIRPARTPEELTAEGKALHHCVGTYSERYASGETEIWFVRRTSLRDAFSGARTAVEIPNAACAPENGSCEATVELDTPFFTCEYRNGHIVQCRTLNNRSYDTEPAVHAFVSEWARLRKRKRRPEGPGRKEKLAAEQAAS